jgi:hypothetical protein
MAKRAFVGRQENICDERIGRLHLDDAGQRKLLWQPILKRVKDALSTACESTFPPALGVKK